MFQKAPDLDIRRQDQYPGGRHQRARPQGPHQQNKLALLSDLSPKDWPHSPYLEI